MADCLGLRGETLGVDELEWSRPPLPEEKRALARRHLRETVDSATEGAFLRARESLRTMGDGSGGGAGGYMETSCSEMRI